MADSDDRELVGVHGWLLFFVIAMSVLSPIAALAQVASLYGDRSIALAYGDAWPSIQLAEWTLLALSLAAVWFLAWRLVYVRNQATVRLVIAGIWIIAVGGLFAELVLVSLIAGIALPLLLQDIGPSVVRPFVFCTIWTLYFMLSKRVANTYRRPAGAEQAAEIFG